MTVIAAYRDSGGRVAIAGDTMLGGCPVTYIDTKLTNVGRYVVGMSGVAALVKLLPKEAETPEAIAEAYIEAVKAAGHGKVDNSGVWCQPNWLLIAGEGRVVEVDGYGGVTEDPCGYGAIGIGAEVAVGVLYAHRHAAKTIHSLSADCVVIDAVEAAIAHVSSCGGRVSGGFVDEAVVGGCDG